VSNNCSEVEYPRNNGGLQLKIQNILTWSLHNSPMNLGTGLCKKSNHAKSNNTDDALEEDLWSSKVSLSASQANVHPTMTAKIIGGAARMNESSSENCRLFLRIMGRKMEKPWPPIAPVMHIKEL
jgi:hypothetical protein